MRPFAVWLVRRRASRMRGASATAAARHSAGGRHFVACKCACNAAAINATAASANAAYGRSCARRDGADCENGGELRGGGDGGDRRRYDAIARAKSASPRLALTIVPRLQSRRVARKRANFAARSRPIDFLAFRRRLFAITRSTRLCARSLAQNTNIVAPLAHTAILFTVCSKKSRRARRTRSPPQRTPRRRRHRRELDGGKLAASWRFARARARARRSLSPFSDRQADSAATQTFFQSENATSRCSARRAWERRRS